MTGVGHLSLNFVMQRHYIGYELSTTDFHLSVLFLSGQLKKYARPSTCSLLESVAQTEGWQQREERAGPTLKKHTLATHKQSHSQNGYGKKRTDRKNVLKWI